MHTATVSGEGLATIPDACEFLSLSRTMVYRLMDNGELPSVKIGNSRRIKYAELRKFIETRPSA